MGGVRGWAGCRQRRLIDFGQGCAFLSQWTPIHAPPTDQPPTAPQDLHPELLQELILSVALNSKAHLIETGPDLVGFVGNRTECALLMMARKWGADYQKVMTYD